MKWLLLGVVVSLVALYIWGIWTDDVPSSKGYDQDKLVP